MTLSEQANERRWSGFFLTIDGPGGVGKSTVTSTLANRFAAAGLPVHSTTEPSTGPMGELARHQTRQLRAEALACLVAADRYHHLTNEVRPALDAGNLVVCDRYVASSLVLQRCDGLTLEYIEAINQYADHPNLSIILTTHPALIRARLATRGSHGRFEDVDATDIELAFYSDAARRLAEWGVNVITIDCANQTPNQIAAMIAGVTMQQWTNVAKPVQTRVEVYT
jgi:dTMP kinase